METLEEARAWVETHRDAPGWPASRFYRNADWMRFHYVEKMCSINDIADALMVSTNTVGTWLRRHGISVRPRVEESKRKSKGVTPPGRSGDRVTGISEAWVRRTAHLSAAAAARKIGAHSDTVWKHRKKLGISRKKVRPINGRLDCIDCGEWKPLAYMVPSAGMACGFQRLCRQCRAERKRGYAKR